MKNDLKQIKKALGIGTREDLRSEISSMDLDSMRLSALIDLYMGRLRASRPLIQVPPAERAKLEALTPNQLNGLYETRVRGVIRETWF